MSDEEHKHRWSVSHIHMGDVVSICHCGCIKRRPVKHLEDELKEVS